VIQLNLSDEGQLLLDRSAHLVETTYLYPLKTCTLCTLAIWTTLVRDICEGLHCIQEPKPPSQEGEKKERQREKRGGDVKTRNM